MNSMGNPQMRLLGKCLFCNNLHVIKWKNNGEKAKAVVFCSFVSLFPSKLSIKFYWSISLSIIPVYSLSISTTTIYYYYLPKSLLQFPDWTPCSFFRELSWKNSHQLISSTWCWIIPLPFPSSPIIFLSFPLARLTFRTSYFLFLKHKPSFSSISRSTQEYETTVSFHTERTLIEGIGHIDDGRTEKASREVSNPVIAKSKK